MTKGKKPETKLPKTPEKQSPKGEPIKVSITLDPKDFQSTLDLMYEQGRALGFQEGVKYIVTLAENFLVEHEKIPSRSALSQSPYAEKLPPWWIATLIEALYYQPPEQRKKQQGMKLSHA